MIRLNMITDSVKDMVDKCDELPQFRFLDYEEMDILLSYNEIILNIAQKNIKKLQKEMRK